MKRRVAKLFGRCGVFHWPAVALAMVVMAAATCPAADNTTKAAKIDEVVTRYQQCGYLNGVVLVAEHGKAIYARGFGDADLDRHIPNTPRTKFDIASITKQFTAVLVLQQAARGKLRLDGTVWEYLPWYRKDTGSRMTVDQLIHHTSGLPADFDKPEFSDGASAAQHYEPLAFAEKFCQPDLAAAPGTQWAYSNAGYLLLGLILERVSGQSFGDLLSQQILVPLGMKDTGIDRNDLGQMGGALGYVRHAGPRYTPGPYLDRGRIFAAGAMYSTAEDLFKWNQALSSDTLLPAQSRALLFKPGLNNWACGWFVTRIAVGQPLADNTLAQMRGDMPGNYFAWTLRCPERDAVIIVLRNTYGSSENLEAQLQAVLFDQPVHLPTRHASDLVAHAAQMAYARLTSPVGWTGVTAVLTLAALGYSRRRRRRSVSAPPADLLRASPIEAGEPERKGHPQIRAIALGS